MDRKLMSLHVWKHCVFLSQVVFEKAPLLSFLSLNARAFIICFYFFTFSNHLFFIKIVEPRTKALIYWWLDGRQFIKAFKLGSIFQNPTLSDWLTPYTGVSKSQITPQEKKKKNDHCFWLKLDALGNQGTIALGELLHSSPVSSSYCCPFPRVPNWWQLS